MNFRKYKKGFFIIGLCILLLLFTYLKPHFTYKIQDNEQAIRHAISELIDKPIEIKLSKDIDNKRIVLFTADGQLGESELTKGTNHKFKLNSSGYGTNEVRYSIINTNNGQYVKVVGRNTDGISMIAAIVDDEKYDVLVDEGTYFITYTPLNKKTDRTFPSVAVYDEQGNELWRIDHEG